MLKTHLIMRQEEMNINVENVEVVDSSDDDEIGHLEDFDYNNEYSEELNEELSEIQVRTLKRIDIRDIDELQKMCCIFFYYETENSYKFCTAYFLRVNDMFSRAHAVRKHETQRYVFLLGERCCNCRSSVSQIVSCSLCPICVQ